MAHGSEFWLDDEAWAAIDPLLPKKQPGAKRVDDRRAISGIRHVLKSGCRLKDCPASYGPPTTIYNRYNRWSRRGIWTRIFGGATAAWPVRAYAQNAEQSSRMARVGILNYAGAQYARVTRFS